MARLGPPCILRTPRCPRAPSAVPGADARGASGLVHISTSDTITLDQAAIRAKRTRQATITTARLMEEQLLHSGKQTYPVMVTLTYAAIDNWSRLHITSFLKSCREWFRRRGHTFRYCWVAELQKRGAVHYHVMIWMPKGLIIPKADKRGWWPHGFTRTEKARNAVGYLAKYVSKDSLRRNFPKGIRLYGCGGLDKAARIEKRWWCSPAWVRNWTKGICDVRRTAGGGFTRIDTGEWRPSPFLVILLNGERILIATRAGSC